METIQIHTGKLVFDCRVAGNKEDELILLLHGFPETSHMWKDLIYALAKLGFYCVAPNQRGYSRGACPSGKKHYRLDQLANDILDLAHFLGRDTFHLIGHDWGAAIGWKVVHDFPNAILSWTGLSVPHLQAFGEAMVHDKVQRRMSRYIKTFQWPFLPERAIRKNDFEVFKKLWTHSSPEEIADYLGVFKNNRQLTAALNYYRSNYALLKKASEGQILGEIHTPTLFIWGKHDMAIGRVAVENAHRYMKGDYAFLELDTGHWLLQTKHAEIQSAISKHLVKYKTAPLTG